MKFLYTTDLHGDIAKYEIILKYARMYGINLIHLGADLLPKGHNIIKVQKKFITRFLKDYYQLAKDRGITVLAFFGNDDIYTGKKYFRQYTRLLDESPYERDGYIFNAYGYVPDYPFSLKTACKLDYDGWFMTDVSRGKPLDVDESGMYHIEDIHEYYQRKGTIENDLKSFKGDSNVIMSIHSPPDGLGLDSCANNRRVGSKSVRKWIEREQPLMVLCGHIHESHSITGQWKGNVGNTLVIQPGQLSKYLSMVLIEVKENEIISELKTVPV